MKKVFSLLILMGSIFNFTYGQCSYSLQTVSNGENNQNGIMFDVKSKSKIKITSFDYYFLTTTSFSIYYKVGTHVGFETNADAWTLIGSCSGVSANGSFTNIPIPVNVIMNTDDVVAFYITSTESEVNIQYSNGTAVGDTLVYNDNLIIYEGTGKKYPFADTFQPRLFNGVINYIADAVAPEMSVLANQTVNLNQGESVYTVKGSEFDPTSFTDNCRIASIVNNFNNLATLENAQLPVGTTTIVWTATDDAGNTTSPSFDVTVNAFVGVSDIALKGISVYPNPTSGVVNFDFSTLEVQKVSISDMTGKVVMEKAVTKQQDYIDFSDYTSGVYLVNIQTRNAVFTTKIVKK